MLAQLNQRFAGPGRQFVTNPQGFIQLVIDNTLAHCEIYLHGAHVTNFTPQGQANVLWLSREVIFKENKSIRGGIPICWPWFGGHPQDPSKGAHGFARLINWQLSDIDDNQQGETTVTFTLVQNQQTLALWPFKFDLTYRVTIGKQLTVELMTTNPNDCDMPLSEALHSYFAVDDINHTVIRGLAGVDYIDAVVAEGVAEGVEKGIANRRQKNQTGDITINQEVDRVYMDTPDTCRLTDNTRTLNIAKSGSQSTVVWNPWIAKAMSMPDVNNDGYQSFVCIETANALSNSYTLAPGESHCISQTIEVEDNGLQLN